MTPKAQQALADPKFYQLPPAEQQKALAMVDKDFGGLPLEERNKVLQMGQQRLNGSPAAAAPPVPPTPSAATTAPPEGFWSSLAAPFVGAAKGVKSAFYEGPQNPSEAALVGADEKNPSWQSPILGRAVLAAKRMLVDPQVEQGKQAVSEFKQADAAAPWNSFSPSPTAVEHRELALGHGLAAAIPFLGPWTASVGQKEGEQIGTGNYKGASGTAVGNILLALTPKVAGKAGAAIRATPEALARAITDTGAGPVKDLVKKTEVANDKIDADNALLDPAHLADTQTALHEMQGRELGYKQDVASKAQDIGLADQSESANLTAGQRAAEQKAAASNDAVRAKHQALAQRVQTTNQAAENTLELRRQHEQAYQQATDTHYAKEAAADAEAKSEENQAWGAWRQKTAGKTLDGGQITGPLQKLRLDSPEVDRTLNQLEPRGDEVPQESPYAQIREQASQQQFGKDYQSLSPVKQDEIDDLLHASGHSPDPIAFDPQAGQPISIDRVQRASSILRRYIRSGRFEGPLLGEMKQVAGVLRNAVTRASADAGAAPELGSARNSTITYQGAFGREIKPSATARTIREKQVNPEAFQTREDEARLSRARRYDPSLVDSYRQVKTAREALDKLPPEDQLRKSLRQVPVPPTVNDPRPGFRLAASPKTMPPRLTSGSPYERAAQAVNQPVRPEFPDRPVPEPRQTISSPDLVAARRAAAEARAGKVQTRGTWVATWPVFQAMRALWGGHIPSLPAMALESAGTFAMTKATTAMMQYPPMMDFLIKARPVDVFLIPPNLRGDLPGLVSLAQRQGIKVAPALVAAAAGAGGQATNQPAQQGAQQ